MLVVIEKTATICTKNQQKINTHHINIIDNIHLLVLLIKLLLLLLLLELIATSLLLIYKWSILNLQIHFKSEVDRANARGKGKKRNKIKEGWNIIGLNPCVCESKAERKHFELGGFVVRKSCGNGIEKKGSEKILK